MPNTVTIDVHDMRVQITNPINIAVINQPNPVTVYVANSDEIEALLQFPRYLIKQSGTSVVINTDNFYDYFPDKKPSGSVLIPKDITENGEYIARDDNADGYSSVNVDVAGGGGYGYTAGYAPKSKHGSSEVSPAGQRTNTESE